MANPYDPQSNAYSNGQQYGGYPGSSTPQSMANAGAQSASRTQDNTPWAAFGNAADAWTNLYKGYQAIPQGFTPQFAAGGVAQPGTNDQSAPFMSNVPIPSPGGGYTSLTQQGFGAAGSNDTAPANQGYQGPLQSSAPPPSGQMVWDPNSGRMVPAQVAPQSATGLGLENRDTGGTGGTPPGGTTPTPTPTPTQPPGTNLVGPPVVYNNQTQITKPPADWGTLAIQNGIGQDTVNVINQLVQAEPGYAWLQQGSNPWAMVGYQQYQNTGGTQPFALWLQQQHPELANQFGNPYYGAEAQRGNFGTGGNYSNYPTGNSFGTPGNNTTPPGGPAPTTTTTTPPAATTTPTTPPGGGTTPPAPTGADWSVAAKQNGIGQNTVDVINNLAQSEPGYAWLQQGSNPWVMVGYQQYQNTGGKDAFAIWLQNNHPDVAQQFGNPYYNAEINRQQGTTPGNNNTPPSNQQTPASPSGAPPPSGPMQWDQNSGRMVPVTQPLASAPAGPTTTPTAPPPQAAPPPSTPGTTTGQPTTPQPTAADQSGISDYLRSLMRPEFAQEQSDLGRQMNAQAALTGNINSGGYGQTYGNAMSRLTADQGSRISNYLQQSSLAQQQLAGQKYQVDTQKAMNDADNAVKTLGITTNDQLQRWLNDPNNDTLQKYGIDQNDVLQKYIENLRLQGTEFQANAQVSAASMQAAVQQASIAAQERMSSAQNSLQNTLSQRNYDLGITGINATNYRSDQSNILAYLQLLAQTDPNFNMQAPPYQQFFPH